MSLVDVVEIYAFWEDQTDQKSAVGGPKRILRTGVRTPYFIWNIDSVKKEKKTNSLETKPKKNKYVILCLTHISYQPCTLYNLYILFYEIFYYHK